jgi:hypothetical protein
MWPWFFPEGGSQGEAKNFRFLIADCRFEPRVHRSSLRLRVFALKSKAPIVGEPLVHEIFTHRSALFKRKDAKTQSNEPGLPILTPLPPLASRAIAGHLTTPTPFGTLGLVSKSNSEDLCV